ncbi:MAG: hypothetical protein CMK80_00205 [Pseudomonadales bacterium]|nr:hypothetical protein [Pseudomonadales bacterium]
MIQVNLLVDNLLRDKILCKHKQQHLLHKVLVLIHHTYKQHKLHRQQEPGLWDNQHKPLVA